MPKGLTTNNQQERPPVYSIYCVEVVVLVGVVVAVDAVNDNSELNEAAHRAAVGKMISPSSSYSNHKKRSSTTNSRYFLEMTASGK